MCRIALKAKGLFPEKGTEADASSSSLTATAHSTGKTAEEVRKESVTGLSFPVYEEMEVSAGEELTDEQRRKRILYSKDRAKVSSLSADDDGDGVKENDDDDAEYVPPGARK